MHMKGRGKAKTRRTWHEKYLPFVARSPEMQVEWIVAALRKGLLSDAEITPYIRILLSEVGSEKNSLLIELLNGLDEKMQDRMLAASDIYDAPRLLHMIRNPTELHAVTILQKTVPPYEKKQHFVLDKVFQSVYDISPELLEKAAKQLLGSGKAPAHFVKEYERFQEIKEDEKILSALYPKARG